MSDMMDSQQSLAERVARLEAQLDELRQELSAACSAPPGLASSVVSPLAPSPLTPDASPGARPTRGAPRPRIGASVLWDGEFWLNKLGIGLLLLGVAFLFRYSIDQGWLTPLVRVGFGVLVGAGLLVSGLRVDRARRRFAPVLLGGGIATFYIVGFAAFQLYGLIGYRTAMAGMILVTLLAFFLAVREDEVALSLVGAIGGLGTPFLLYSAVASPTGVIAYTCSILAGTTALFLYRGWWSVLWVSILGGWATLWVSTAGDLWSSAAMTAQDRNTLQAAVAFCWLLFWALPVAREVYRARRASTVSALADAELHARGGRSTVALHIHLLSASTPTIALVLSKLIWAVPSVAWGWITLGFAAGYALIGAALMAISRPVAEAQVLTAAILAAIGSVAALNGEALLLALAAQAAALHVVSRRLTVPAVPAVAHATFAVIALWLAARLFEGGFRTADRLADAAVLLVAVAASEVFESRAGRLVYRFAAHAAFLGWLWRELGSLPNGAAYVTIAWGVYAVLLLAWGLRADVGLLQRTAVGTLLLIVAKLFLVDLAALDAIWRILLFLGLGTGFLFLSYSLQTLWRPKADASGR
jgi:uncharacterized membrane protein